MYSVTRSFGLNGLSGFAVAVEADISGGLPAFSIVGLPDSAVRESADRVRAAIKNLGFKFPDRRITINLAPADVRKTGRSSMGVIGMNLSDGDEVVAMQMNTQGEYLLIASEYGMGKLTEMSEFTAQNRGGKGIKCYKILEKTGNVVGAKAVHADNDIMMISTEGIIIQMACEDISVLGRVTSGVKLMSLDPEKDVKVASIARVKDSAKKTEEDTLKSLEEELKKEES
jgi:DNA gyrase subunit A